MSKIRSLLRMEPEPPGKPVPSMAFMTGCMRSGTSFLVGKLSQHPQIMHIGSELNSVWTSIGGAPCNANCDYRDESHFDVGYAQNMAAYFAQYARDAQMFRRKAMRWRHKRRTGSGRLDYDWDRLICLNKSTHLTNKTRYVKALFPQSKWIILIRSILGNAASTKIFFNQLNQKKGLHFAMPDDPRACWTMSRRADGLVSESNGYPGDFRTIPRMWLRLNRQLLEDLDKLPSDDVVLVPYERLVTDQAAEVNAIFNTLDLAEEHVGVAADIARRSMQPINTSTKGDPLTKWKKNLTKDELSIIRQEIESAQDTFSYINHRLETITAAQGEAFRYQDPVSAIEELLK